MARRRDLDIFTEITARDKFVDLVADGIPFRNAALEVGWTPRQMHQYLQDSEFREIVEDASARATETIEEVLYKKAKQGNSWAVQMWLYNRDSDRWRDLKRIEVKTEVHMRQDVVLAVKTSALDLLREVGVEVLQELPPMIEVDYEDTEER